MTDDSIIIDAVAKAIHLAYRERHTALLPWSRASAYQKTTSRLAARKALAQVRKDATGETDGTKA